MRVLTYEEEAALEARSQRLHGQNLSWTQVASRLGYNVTPHQACEIHARAERKQRASTAA